MDKEDKTTTAFKHGKTIEVKPIIGTKEYQREELLAKKSLDEASDGWLKMVDCEPLGLLEIAVHLQVILKDT